VTARFPFSAVVGQDGMRLALLLNAVRPGIGGLLAAAHRGVLSVEEVNLLADHLVDLPVDVAAMGWAHVERAGVSVSHAAWRGGAEVTAGDVEVGARLALPHRRRREPLREPASTRRSCTTRWHLMTSSRGTQRRDQRIPRRQLSALRRAGVMG
jgi:Mg-chelatase subunit ChlI